MQVENNDSLIGFGEPSPFRLTHPSMVWRMLLLGYRGYGDDSGAGLAKDETHSSKAHDPSEPNNTNNPF